MKAVVLSNRMHSVLTEAVNSKGLSLDRMLQLSQISVGPMIAAHRGYLKWNPKAGEDGLFEPTKVALEVFRAFGYTDVSRKNTNRPLSRQIPMSPGLDKRLADRGIPEPKPPMKQKKPPRQRGQVIRMKESA